MALHPLSNQKDTDLPNGAYDVRGWEVRTSVDDHHVGTVRDMLLDGERWPRYLDVKVEATGRHVLLPLDRARADAAHEVVVVPGLTSERFEALPSWAGDLEALGPEYEARLQAEYGRALRGGVGPSSEGEAEPRLARLSDLDRYRVSKGSEDVRGWTVLAGDGTELGEVVELLVDRSDLEVAYLVVRLDEEELGLEPVDRQVVLPVQRARLVVRKKKVVVEGLFASDFATYPVYTGLPLDEDHRRRVERLFTDPPDQAVSVGGPESFFGRARPRRRAPARVGASSREATAAGSAGRDPDREGVVVEETAGDMAVLRKGDRRVRIRISGDDILIERPEEADRG